ncbi:MULTISPECIES: YkuS family protein [unclassified Paenibacillus]|uniref:YkuS family protein n=1 Tax=unclassified Paenibacillus TaxID=185978 RepID=UPI001C10C2A2|nr:MULTISPECIES: YkuS family protein [unclassified Paenibacillus]MBU5440890.1 YkuS family protein [Paenibacillus sp. MSJ-34]CAH0118409.1 hypothetical protein PAE9249_00896 [Paenibacillus sp. CECT 9249]
MAKVALEDSLNSVADALQRDGHEVVSMNNVADCDCCVISGQDKNVMGMSGIETKASVINAQGLSSDEIVNQVNRAVNNKR